MRSGLRNLGGWYEADWSVDRNPGVLGGWEFWGGGLMAKENGFSEEYCGGRNGKRNECFRAAALDRMVKEQAGKSLGFSYDFLLGVDFRSGGAYEQARGP